jgi:hypothetical protein
MNIEALRKWLMVLPRPAVIKLQVGAEEQVIEVTRNVTWKAFATSIDTVNPDSITLIGPDKKLLRAAKGEQFGDDSPTDEGSGGPVDLGKITDAETQRFIAVANLIADAHKFSEVAFDKLVAILDAQVRQAESKERALASTERMLREEMQANLQLMAQKDPDLLEDVVGTFMRARAEAIGATPAKPNGTNGKAKQI